MARIRTAEQLVEGIRQQFIASVVQYRLVSKSWLMDGSPINSKELHKFLAHEVGVSLSRVQNAMAVIQREEEVRYKRSVRKWFADNDGLAREDHELIKYLNLMERPGTSPALQEANRLALKQWLWQVKRGVAGKKAIWQTALIFWSKENGTGKSTNVDRLLNPLRFLSRQLSIKDLGERFSGQLFANTIVGFFDEFAGVEAAASVNLKSILTGCPWEGRVMHSEDGFHAENHTSLIATSNLSPPHGYEDTSGARRFWSIHCDGRPMKETPERKAAFDALDIGKIYASVRTNDPCPDEMAPRTIRMLMDAEREERLRTKTSLESWLTECTEPAEPEYKLPFKEILTDCGRYTSQTKQAVVKGSYRTICEKLRELGQTIVRSDNRYYMKGRCLSTFDAT